MLRPDTLERAKPWYVNAAISGIINNGGVALALPFRERKNRTSPRAGFVLLDQIVPRLRSAIPQCVVPVGAEDHEELVQDAIVFAAQMMDRLEQVGKEVTPGNVAYYTILHMKSGRRSRDELELGIVGQREGSGVNGPPRQAPGGRVDTSFDWFG